MAIHKSDPAAVGVILAGGSGSRLGPISRAVNKHLLPVFDKPLVYYPLSTLMLAGVRQVCIVCRSRDAAGLHALLGDGSHIGINIVYRFQDEPRGVVHGFRQAESVVEQRASWLVLGDNILLGAGLGTSLSEGRSDEYCRIFAYEVEDVSPYGAVELSSDESRVTSLVEKPIEGGRGLAIPGLYWLPSDAQQEASSIELSRRGEYEIVDLLGRYLTDSRLSVSRLPRGSVWIDAGTPDALERGSHLVSLLSSLQGRVLASPEEIAWLAGWIDDEQLERSAEAYRGSGYGAYLLSLLVEQGTERSS